MPSNWNFTDDINGICCATLIQTPYETLVQTHPNIITTSDFGNALITFQLDTDETDVFYTRNITGLNSSNRNISFIVDLKNETQFTEYDLFFFKNGSFVGFLDFFGEVELQPLVNGWGRARCFDDGGFVCLYPINTTDPIFLAFFNNDGTYDTIVITLVGANIQNPTAESLFDNINLTFTDNGEQIFFDDFSNTTSIELPEPESITGNFIAGVSGITTIGITIGIGFALIIGVLSFLTKSDASISSLLRMMGVVGAILIVIFILLTVVLL